MCSKPMIKTFITKTKAVIYKKIKFILGAMLIISTKYQLYKNIRKIFTNFINNNFLNFSFLLIRKNNKIRHNFKNKYRKITTNNNLIYQNNNQKYKSLKFEILKSKNYFQLNSVNCRFKV